MIDTSVGTKQVTIRKGELFEMGESEIATCFTCDGFRTMTIEEFKEKVVPDLKTTEASGPFYYYVLRDLSNGKYTVIEPDGVMEYHVDRVSEIPIEKLSSKLQEMNDSAVDRKREAINSPLPVLSWSKFPGGWEMFVKIPETKFRFNSVSSIPSCTIYMPPVIYGVEGTDTGVFRQSYIRVLVQDSVDVKRIKLGALQLPNVECGSGHICVGNTTIDSEDITYTPAQLIATSWELFLGSNWNLDYIWSTNKDYFPSNVFEVADSLPDAGMSYKRYGDQPESRLRALLTVLHVPGAWEKLKWPEAHLRGVC